MEDTKLLQLLNTRNDSAIAALARRFGQRLFRTAYNILGSREDAEEEVDFILDRPFLFVVESADGVPMFTGIVNQP